MKLARLLMIYGLLAVALLGTFAWARSRAIAENAVRERAVLAAQETRRGIESYARRLGHEAIKGASPISSETRTALSALTDEKGDLAAGLHTSLEALRKTPALVDLVTKLETAENRWIQARDAEQASAEAYASWRQAAPQRWLLRGIVPQGSPTSNAAH
jgi:hypothetical protein